MFIHLHDFIELYKLYIQTSLFGAQLIKNRLNVHLNVSINYEMGETIKTVLAHH